MAGVPAQSLGSAKMRMQRSMFKPEWVVPPRVLLVDDDAVSRRLVSEFLQVFGCTIDIALHGFAAVNKMNTERYDLVLMVGVSFLFFAEFIIFDLILFVQELVMPQLDGILATSMIRKFDNITPIVSTTANLDPDVIISCPPAGMNDVLPKPFTKVSLGIVLERHLSHLKVIRRKAKVPRSLGIPRLSDTGVDQELVVAVQQQQQRERDARHQLTQDLDDEGGGALAKTNPLAGMGPMGMSDEEYVDILQHMASAGDFQPEQGGRRYCWSPWLHGICSYGDGRNGHGRGAGLWRRGCLRTRRMMDEGSGAGLRLLSDQGFLNFLFL